jgi:hypothetical protein
MIAYQVYQIVSQRLSRRSNFADENARSVEQIRGHTRVKICYGILWYTMANVPVEQGDAGARL